MKHHRHTIALVATLAAFGLTQAFGQTVSPATPAPSAPAGKDEVIELSPFVVTSDEDEGYQASNTLAGSRMATSLRNTAASVSVLTTELLNDIGAINLDDAIAFAVNVELDDTQVNNDNATFEFFNTYRIRGQAATVGRNYFRWKVPSHTYNIERIEEARGPNSILFGIASAGGMISANTKQANTNRNIRNSRLIYGSYDLRSASIDVNQASDNRKFALRFNAVHTNTQGYQHYVFHREERAHLAAKYNLTPNTIIRAEYETGKSRTNRANFNMVGDNVTTWINAGRPVLKVTATNNALGITRNGTGVNNLALIPIETSPGVFTMMDTRGLGVTQGAGGMLLDPAIADPENFTINIGGPGQTQEQGFQTWSAYIDHRLFKNTHVQVAYNYQDYTFDGWQARLNTGLKGDPNQYLFDGVTPNPYAGRLYFENLWTLYERKEDLNNYRISLSQELNLGKWGEYRFAGLAEREETNWAKDGYTEQWVDEATGRGAFNASVGASNNRVLRRHYVTEGDYSTYINGWMTPAQSGLFSGIKDPNNPNRSFRTIMAPAAGGFDDPTEQNSYLFSGQAFYLKRKLVVAGGYRYDKLWMHEGQRGLLDPVTNVPLTDYTNVPRTHRTAEARTKTLGALYHAFNWLSLRYNKSDSQELANVNVRLMPLPDADGFYQGSRVGDNPQGKGEDYGFDLSLFDGKIFIRGVKFETTRAGAQAFTYGGTVDAPAVMSNRVLDALENRGLITPAEGDRHRLLAGGSTFSVASSGYELSLTANPTKNWRLTFNYSDTDSVTSNIAPEIQEWARTEIPWMQKFDQNIVVSTGDTIAQEIARWQLSNENNRSVEGLATAGNRPKKVSVLTRYSFGSGPLKGFFVGGSARHQGKVVVGATTAQQLVYGNSFTATDAFCGYKFGRVPYLKFLKNLSVQLNVYNLLDNRDALVIRYADNNAATLRPNRTRLQEPRYWRLTADLAF